jgi:MFS family permease
VAAWHAVAALHRMNGAWAPLRHGAFRSLWSAQLASNTGSWMQTVGAQWLMLSLTSSATLLSLIQSAASLPVLLFAIPAGAVGDLVDRRRLLLAAQAWMLAAALLLAVLAQAGVVTPWTLLALLFAVGAGQAWTAPTWQTLQPELVPAGERSQAIALGSVNMNLARAVGPAIGGALVAATSPSTTFFVNAATFLVVIAAVARWRSERAAASGLPPEHVRSAIRASGRYVANSPALRSVLLRAAVFVFPASALWALMPAVARNQLGLGSGGYGLLLGAVGAGAVCGALVLARLRARGATPDTILVGASAAVALGAVALAEVHVVALVIAALAVAGVGWILALATLNSTYQAMLPGWVKARALAYYLIVFQGGLAIGSAALGGLAGGIGVETVLLVAAGGLVVGPLVTRRRPIPRIDPSELLPAADWPPAPLLAEPVSGPVLITVEYRAAAGSEAAMAEAVLALRRARRRTGASSWSAWRDTAEPGLMVEQFVVATWEEHERQHARLTERDRARIQAVHALMEPGTRPRVVHWTQIPVTRSRA